MPSKDFLDSRFEQHFGSVTPASYKERLRTWFHKNWCDDFGPPENPPYRTVEELQTRHIGEAERTAVSLLATASIRHPVLRRYIERLCEDPTFVMGIDEFAEQPLSHQFHEMTASPEEADSEAEQADNRYRNSVDSAINTLAMRIRYHRLNGESNREETISLHAANVVTSLAANVAEYVAHLQDAEATRRRDMHHAQKNALRRLLPADLYQTVSRDPAWRLTR